MLLLTDALLLLQALLACLHASADSFSSSPNTACMLAQTTSKLTKQQPMSSSHPGLWHGHQRFLLQHAEKQSGGCTVWFPTLSTNFQPNKACNVLHVHLKCAKVPPAGSVGFEKKEKTTPLGVNLMRSPVLYRAAQVYWLCPCSASSLHVMLCCACSQSCSSHSLR